MWQRSWSSLLLLQCRSPRQSSWMRRRASIFNAILFLHHWALTIYIRGSRGRCSRSAWEPRRRPIASRWRLRPARCRTAPFGTVDASPPACRLGLNTTASPCSRVRAITGRCRRGMNTASPSGQVSRVGGRQGCLCLRPGRRSGSRARPRPSGTTTRRPPNGSGRRVRMRCTTSSRAAIISSSTSRSPGSRSRERC